MGRRSSDGRREGSKDDSDIHPIYRRKKYTIATPVTEAALETAAEHLRGGFSGLLYYGEYRSGKTWTIKFIRANLAEELGRRVADFYFDCTPELKTPNQHYRWMLDELKYSYALRDPSQETRLHNYILSEVARRKAQDVVLIFDEAQNLRPVQWRFLVRTHNALSREGPPPMFMFFGQPELAKTRDAFVLQPDKQNIVGRFMLHEHVIEGVRNAVEFKHWLGLFDNPDVAEWPANSGISFTRYFFPRAYAAGWRLASLSEAWWMLIRTLLERERILQVPKTLRTQYLFFMVEQLFRVFADHESRKPDIGDKELAEVITRSKYLDSIRFGLPKQSAR